MAHDFRFRTENQASARNRLARFSINLNISITPLTNRQGSQVKRSSSWIAVLPSLIIPVCIGLMMYLGLSYLIQEGKIANETVLRYLTGHPVSKVTLGMFFIGFASLALIENNVFEQFGAARKISIKPDSEAEIASRLETNENPAIDLDSRGEAGNQTVELCKRLLDLPSWMHEHYLWQRILNTLHAIYRTNSTEVVEGEMKYLADLDLDRQQQRYSLVRILIWATPMLGFLGTVLGISQALGGINVGPDNNFQQMMDGLRGSLYVAFDTTALALTLSMILMFGQFLVERFESQLLELVDHRAKQEIDANFDMTINTTETTYENVAKDFLEASRISIENQTESWRETIRSAESAWTASLGRANQQAQIHLTQAIDASVSNLAKCLGVAIEKADNSMSHRWGQWQVTLSDNARQMANYQRQLAEQMDLAKQLLEKSKSKEVFQSAIDQNHLAIEATAKLRESMDELAATIAEMKPGFLVDEVQPTPMPVPESNLTDPSAEVVFGHRVRVKKNAAAFAKSDHVDRVPQNVTVSMAPPETNSNAEVVLPVRAAGSGDTGPRNSKKVA